MHSLNIRRFSINDEAEVISLWRRCHLIRPWNNPSRDIERKMKVNPELFLVGSIDDIIVAVAMGGYEGHRGWVNYLAVDPLYQRRGFGRLIIKAIEDKIYAMGCPKINVQIRKDNHSALEFYRHLGFITDETVSMGKRLVDDT
jgi:ribosomal protein S18 acetylase RimI-like enzyme